MMPSSRCKQCDQPSVEIEGAYFEGRAAQTHGANGSQPDAPMIKVRGEAQKVGAAVE